MQAIWSEIRQGFDQWQRDFELLVEETTLRLRDQLRGSRLADHELGERLSALGRAFEDERRDRRQQHIDIACELRDLRLLMQRQFPNCETARPA